MHLAWKIKMHLLDLLGEKSPLLDYVGTGKTDSLISNHICEQIYNSFLN